MWPNLFSPYRTILIITTLCVTPLSMTFVRRWPPFPFLSRAWTLFWRSSCSHPSIQIGKWRLERKDARAWHHLSPVSPIFFTTSKTLPAHPHGTWALSIFAKPKYKFSRVHYINVLTIDLYFTGRMQGVVNRLSACLKHGGIFLFRDYGRYDFSQLRFKKGEAPTYRDFI